MNAEQLLEAIGEVDEALLERSEKRRRFPWVAALAACAALILLGALVWEPLSYRTMPTDVILQSRETFRPADNRYSLGPNTSDTYQTLEQLLAHLGVAEEHGSESYGKGNTITGVGYQSRCSLAVYGDYAYHAGKDAIYITALNDTAGGAIGQIDVPYDIPAEHVSRHSVADYLFIQGPRLAVIRDEMHFGDEDFSYSAYVALYDLTDPLSPVKCGEFRQSGSITACYMAQDDLVLLTADGVCACGYSRLDPQEGYHPALQANGQAVPWTEDDFSILGEPTKLNYLAAIRIDLASQSIADKECFYGGIREVFYGSDWLGLAVGTSVYTYRLDDGLRYAGKLQDLGINEIFSVEFDGSRWRIIARSGWMELVAISADPETGAVERAECSFPQWDPSKALPYRLDDLIWEKDRALVALSCNTDSVASRVGLRKEEALLLAVDFSQGLRFSHTPLDIQRIDSVTGVVSMGDPFGDLHTMIPLENDLIVRFNTDSRSLDLIDLSDSMEPKLVHDGQAIFPEQAVLYPEWVKLEENCFGVMLYIRDYETRQRLRSWYIIQVDPSLEQPFRAIACIDLDKEEVHNLVYGYTVLSSNTGIFMTPFGSERIYKPKP